MAFDQVSLFLYPPGWARTSVAHGALHASGRPVRVVSAVRAGDGPGVRIDDLCRWLDAAGFEAGVRGADYADFASAPPPGGSSRPEIDLAASATAGEVTSLYCRFLLTPDAPDRLGRWAAFVRGLSAAFGLRIGVADGSATGPEEFEAVVRRADNWKAFAAEFGWPGPGDGGPAEPPASTPAPPPPSAG